MIRLRCRHGHRSLTSSLLSSLPPLLFPSRRTQPHTQPRSGNKGHRTLYRASSGTMQKTNGESGEEEVGVTREEGR